MRKPVVAIAISLLVLTATLTLRYAGAFDRLEFFLYDAMHKRLRADKKPHEKVKVILIDETSLKAMENVAGRWPWPRAIWADLLEFLSAGGAKTVLFDILFTEKQGGSDDEALVSATRSFGDVVHSMMVLREAAADAPELGRPMPADFVKRFASSKVGGKLKTDPSNENNNFYLPFRELYEASARISVVEFSPDSDGAFRRTIPLREYQGNYFPVLGLAPFVSNSTPVAVTPNEVKIGDRSIPVDENGNYIINMYGKIEPYSIGGIFSSLQKIRAGDVEGLLVNPEEFRDAIVYVGGSAVGVEDLKATPLSPRTPGVLLHVSLASNYLLDDFLRPPNKDFTMISIIIGSFLTAFLVLSSKRFLLRSMLPIAVLASYGVYYYLYYTRTSTAVEAVPFIFSTFWGSFLSFGYLTFTEAKDKRKVSQLFSQYVSKDVLDEIMRHRDYVRTAGQKVEVSVLFTDIRGFTTFSENTPPERVVEMLNCFFSKMAEIILRHKGTLDKYIGDAIMAFWGAPVPDHDHAFNAVSAGIEMLDALSDVNQTLKERGYGDFELKIGIGINTGSVTIGNIGSEKKLNYTIVGDAVNLASRLESVTKEYGSPLVISEYTYDKIKDRIWCGPLGSVKVKGREKQVMIYAPEIKKPEINAEVSS